MSSTFGVCWNHSNVQWYWLILPMLGNEKKGLDIFPLLELEDTVFLNSCMSKPGKSETPALGNGPSGCNGITVKIESIDFLEALWRKRFLAVFCLLVTYSKNKSKLIKPIEAHIDFSLDSDSLSTVVWDCRNAILTDRLSSFTMALLEISSQVQKDCKSIFHCS